MTNILHSSHVADPTLPNCCEEMQILPLHGVITDCEIAADELHIADLPLAAIAKCAVRVPSVVIAIGFATFTRE